MGINTVPQLPYSPDLAPCDFWLFPKLRGCRYETIEKMKEAVTKVIDMLTQEDFHGALQKLLERYNKCIAARGDHFEGDKSFMRVLSIKVPIRKKSGNLFNDPRIVYRWSEKESPVSFHLRIILVSKKDLGWVFFFYFECILNNKVNVYSPQRLLNKFMHDDRFTVRKSKQNTNR